MKVEESCKTEIKEREASGNECSRGVHKMLLVNAYGFADANVIGEQASKVFDESVRIESLNYCFIKVIYAFSSISFKENLHSQV